MTILYCESCSGEGRIYKSRYGGNDPDVWDAGQCPSCKGSGLETCANGCGEPAVGRDEANNPLCRGCFDDWCYIDEPAAGYG